MPDDRRLSTLVLAGVDVRGDLRALARDVAAFHSTARTNAEITAEAGPDPLLRRWWSNLEDLRRRGLPADQADLIWDEASAYVEGRHPLFASRASDGLVRDGHGDLLADDVFCLADGPRALDCLDFDDHLRWVDVLDDVACLVMDLERLGAPDVAWRFAADYREFAGHPQPDSLLHHYVAYRAVMRAKVAAIRRDQTGPDGEEPCEQELNRLMRIGIGHLAEGQVRLLLVGGGPATGKTTLAGAVADATGAVLLSSDRVRKETLGLDPSSRHPSAYGHGIYTPAVTERTYRAVADRAALALTMGESVVVDASFARDSHRRLFGDVARRTRASLVQVECVPEPSVVSARLRARATRPDAYTDAGPEVARRMRVDVEPWPEAYRVNTGGNLAGLVDLVRRQWDPAWRPASVV